MPPTDRPSDHHYRRAGLWRGETLWAAWDATAARVGDKPAIVEGARRTSFPALAAQAERLAEHLEQRPAT